MEIFCRACLFFVAVLFLSYLPGKVLLVFLKLKPRLLEDVSLSCSLGLIISGFVYWLTMFLHQGWLFILWPLITIVVFASLYQHWLKRLKPWFRRLPSASERLKEGSFDISYLILGATVALGIGILAVLPLYYSNLVARKDGTMHVHAVYDVFFHLAIANELTYSIPPQAPVFAGRPLNYHYGMDLAVAMFAKVSGLETPDLLLRFVPTLFLILAMLSVYCFGRRWLRSSYWASILTFLVFFGEDFSFIPGFLFGERADWSVRFFNVPAVLSLFYINAMLPAVGLLFLGLFCLHNYLQKHASAWLVLSAIIFASLLEVKLFTAAQIMICLGLAAIVHLLVFRRFDLLKVAALTAILALPFLLSVLMHNQRGAELVAEFKPWPYVPAAMQLLGLKNEVTSAAAFAAIALPIYLIGCLGLRIVGFPKLLRDLILPKPETSLSFVLALFVIVGIVITLTLRIVPPNIPHPYNNSVWFLAQSKYVAWIFAVDTLQSLSSCFSRRKRWSQLTTASVTVLAVSLSVPSTVQHFLLERNPYPIYGKAIMAGSDTYDRPTLAITTYLRKEAQPGDVVLTDDNMIGPILALTRCRVPLGYYATYLVSYKDLVERQSSAKNFWQAWRAGRIRLELLAEARVRYVVADKAKEGVPATYPPNMSKVFENSDYAVFRIGPRRT